MTDPTSHPEELLAVYIDGDLEHDRLAELEAHLASCERCAEEVRLAGIARSALGGLPEAEVPLGTLRPVERSIAERSPSSAAASSSPAARRERRRRDPSRVLAGLAIAAVLVILGGIVLAPLLHGGGGVSTQEAAGAPAPAREPAQALSKADLARLPSPGVQQENADYDGVSIQAVAQAAAHDPVRFARAGSEALTALNPGNGAASNAGDSLGAGTSGGGAATPSGTPAAQPSTVDQEGGTAGNAPASYAAHQVSRSEANSTTRCFAQWTNGKSIIQKNLHPLRIVKATYQGSPATIAVYLQTAGQGTPGKVLIWVLDPDCRLISFVQRAL